MYSFYTSYYQIESNNKITGQDSSIESFLSIITVLESSKFNRSTIILAKKKMKFSPSVQHAKNTGVMLQCEDCDKWRLAFSKTKLNKVKREQLEGVLADVSFTCGFLFGTFYSDFT